MLDRLKNIFGLERVELYRDDGIAVLPNSSSFKVEKLKNKRMPSSSLWVYGSLLNHQWWQLTTRMWSSTCMVSPICFIKGKTQESIIKNSSHPKKIINHIPNTTNERLDKRSSNEENFLKTKHDYKLIMKKCGYNDKPNFEKTEKKKNEQ